MKKPRIHNLLGYSIREIVFSISQRSNDLLSFMNGTTAMAYRQRLRTNTGCVGCRSRRKKCDENKPSCKRCHRLHLSCVYSSPGDPQHTPRTHLHQSQLEPAHAQDAISHLPPISEQGERVRHRVADFSTPSTTPPQFNVNDYLLAFETSNANFTSRSELQDLELEHCLVLGVCRGWNRTPTTDGHPTLTQAQQAQLATMDEAYRGFGHGPVARLAFSWLFCVLSQVKS